MESGVRLTERYRLVERLDRGGTTEVWRARDELLGRTVAVKLPASGNAAAHRAFQRGVGRAAGISHPALETVYDSDEAQGRSGGVVSYAVTEFLDGETLAARLRHGPLPAAATADFAEQVAGALAAAHAAGVAHGRLSPGKVMLVDGDAKVIGTGAGAAASGADMAADVRALGALISACLPSGTSGGPVSVAALCLDATAADGPSAADAAALLERDAGPANAVFGPPAAFAETQQFRPAVDRPARDQRTRALRPPPRPRRYGAGARLAALAVVVAIPVTAGAAVLASAPRSPVIVPVATGTVQPPPRGTRRVTSALARMRPIVSSGYAAGEIRSDVAIDLNDAITDLETDLAADRKVDVNGRIGLLRARIAARQRERGLSPDVADQLTRVLATVRA